MSKNKLIKLADRVEGGDTHLDLGAFTAGLGDDYINGVHTAARATDAYNLRSIDAAVSLLGEVLPGWKFSLFSDTLFNGCEMLPACRIWDYETSKAAGGKAPTPAAALVAATLRALAEKEEG